MRFLIRDFLSSSSPGVVVGGSFNQYVCETDVGDVFLERAWLQLGGTRQGRQQLFDLGDS